MAKTKSRKKREVSHTTGNTTAYTQLATRIPVDLHRKLKLHCVTHDVSMSSLITDVLSKAIKA